MLVYSLGGGVNGLITIVQWSVKSHHSNLAFYSYIFLALMHAHKNANLHLQTYLPAPVCRHGYKITCEQTH